MFLIFYNTNPSSTNSMRMTATTITNSNSSNEYISVYGDYSQKTSQVSLIIIQIQVKRKKYVTAGVGHLLRNRRKNG